MKLAALDKSTCAMSANNNHRAQSGYNYVGKMLKNKEESANIPLETVTDGKSELRRRDSARQTRDKYIQCILPFLCILQVVNVVSVSVCFYLYKVTLDDYTSVQKEVWLLRYNYEVEVLKLRNEIETNITAQIRDVQQIAGNLTLAKSQINDYDENDYEQYETDHEDGDTEAASSPNVSEEPDNQPPTVKMRDEQRRKAHQLLVEDKDDDEQDISIPNTSTMSSQEVHVSSPITTNLDSSRTEVKNDETSEKNERNTRSIHFDKKLYEGINPDKNAAEGDYMEVPLLQAKPSHTRYRHIEETVAVSERYKEKKSTHEGKYNVNHTEITSTTNETKDLKQLDTARSLKLMEETLLEVRLSRGQSHKEEPKANPQYNMPPPANNNRLAMAIHLVGDTSKYKVNKEKHYDGCEGVKELVVGSLKQLMSDANTLHFSITGHSENQPLQPTQLFHLLQVNHRMYHPKGQFKDWKIDLSISGQEHTNEENFKLENGHLKVKESGLYFVYAQIYYSSKEDTSGFNIFLNDNVMMRCITTGVTSEQLEAVHATAPNSCYTARLIQISPGDTLSIKETQGERFTIFEPTRSFFGLFKVG